MAKRAKCVAVAKQSGKPCQLPAQEGALVCSAHSGLTVAQKKALDKGQKKRDIARAERRLRKERGEDGPTAGERWAMLLSGQITVKDLDDDEVRFMRVRNRDGQFSGKARSVPSHLARQMQEENLKRAKEKIWSGVPQAVQALLDIAEDPDHKDRRAAAQYLIDRGLGKTPDVLEVKAESKFDAVAGTAVGIERTVADEAESYLASKTHGKDAR